MKQLIIPHAEKNPVFFGAVNPKFGKIAKNFFKLSLGCIDGKNLGAYVTGRQVIVNYSDWTEIYSWNKNQLNSRSKILKTFEQQWKY